MRELARRLEGEFVAVHVDLQGAAGPEDLVVELALASREHRELHKRALDVFRNALGDVTQLQARELAVQIRSTMTDWQSKANRLLDEFVANTPPVVVYFDELAILVNRLLKGHDYRVTPARVAAVDQLMSWLRAASIRHTRQIRFVIASSIGLAPVLSQAKLSATLNTFTRFHLPPWDRETASGALSALANHARIGWAEGASDAVLDRLGIHVPHHVQVFWRSLREDARQRKVFYVTRADVERVYQTHLLGSHGHLELAHYEERLSTSLGSELAELAVDLLSETAIVGALSIPSARALASESEPQALRDVIHVLIHDGYLQLERDDYVFANKLLQDWWRARHRLTHRPLAQRGTHG
ncbi:hypothetical protein [Enhygromyxa salina]|nr:hypothetical protein [Enhygromyxa salina]